MGYYGVGKEIVESLMLMSVLLFSRFQHLGLTGDPVPTGLE